MINISLIIFAIALPLSIVVCFIKRRRPTHYDPEIDIHIIEPAFDRL